MLTPKLVNDFRFAYSYFRNRLSPPSQEDCESLASDPTFCFGVGGPQISLFGGLTIGNNINTPQDRHPRTYQFTDNVSWTKGTHRVALRRQLGTHLQSRELDPKLAGTFSAFSPTTVSESESQPI